MPTAVLSAHTAFPGFVSRDLTDQLDAIAAHWQAQHVHFDALYTGYIASVPQVQQVLDFFDAVKSPDTMIFVDPAMADHGKLYSGLWPRLPRRHGAGGGPADVAMPNLTEACLLTGTPYREDMDEPMTRELLQKVAALGAGKVVLTGVSFTPDRLGAMGYDSADGRFFTCLDRRQTGSYHGTGDIFAAHGGGRHDAGACRWKMPSLWRCASPSPALMSRLRTPAPPGTAWSSRRPCPCCATPPAPCLRIKKNKKAPAALQSAAGALLSSLAAGIGLLLVGEPRQIIHAGCSVPAPRGGTAQS